MDAQSAQVLASISAALPRIEEKLANLTLQFDRIEAEVHDMQGHVGSLRSERDKVVGGASVLFTIATALGGFLFWVIDRIQLK